MSSNGNGNKLAKVPTFAIQALTDDQAAIMAEVFEEERPSLFDFDELKIPAGGAQNWAIEDETGEEKTAKTIDGILVATQRVRAYYAEGFSGESKPPDCYSPNASDGIGAPGGTCADCPFSQWGSAVNEKGEASGGQACSERRHCLILLPDSVLPMFLDVPPTSVKAIKQYGFRLGGKGVRTNAVLTQFGLEKGKSGSFEYSKLTLKNLGPLPPELAARIADYSGRMQALLQTGVSVAERLEPETAEE